MICPCDQHRPYESCCGRFHQGQIPETALELMRSRFSAYALNLPDYIMETTHPASPQIGLNRNKWRDGIEAFAQEYTFDQLEILDFQESGDSAAVTFVVTLKHGQEEVVFTECSYFDRLNGRWFYRTGFPTEGRDPSRIHEGSLDLLPLAYLGDEVLRQKAKPVEEVTDEVIELVDAMKQALYVSNGAGLAAPQVHRSLRIFLMDPLSEGEPEVCINPEIIEASDEKELQAEGCLSIPGIYVEVERSKRIILEYTNLQGERIRKELVNFSARVPQHELDHLNGVLMTDLVSSDLRETVDQALFALENRLRN